MATFNTYQQSPGETPLARKWFVWALLASLAIHAALFFTFRQTKLDHFTPTTDRLVPRTFTSLGRVEVDEKLLAEVPEKKPEDETNTQQPVPNIEVPSEKPSATANPQDTVFTPTAPEAVKPIATDNPKVADSDLKTLNQMQQSVTKDLDKALNTMSEQLVKDSNSSAKPLLKFSETKGGGTVNSSASGETAIPGTKSLDDALSSTGGGLKNGDKVGIRGGALFSFGKADISVAAQGRLQQLVALIKRYPNATIVIEGYTDSIGDPASNQQLSQNRADAVKAFLLTAGIADARIQAIGKGSTNFKDAPTYDFARQDAEQNNRRVEIQFKFPN